MRVSAPGITSENPDFRVEPTYFVQAAKKELTMIASVLAILCEVRGSDIEICLTEPKTIPSDHLFAFDISSIIPFEETKERYAPDAFAFKESILLASRVLHFVTFKICLPPRSCFPVSLAEHQP